MERGQGKRKGIGLAGYLNYIFSPFALISLVVGIVGPVYFTYQDMERRVAEYPRYCEARGFEVDIPNGHLGVKTPEDGPWDDIGCQVYKTDFGGVFDPLKNLELLYQ